MGAPGWPVTLQDGRVGVRPLRMRDAAAWSQLRTANEEWLSPWEAVSPGMPYPPHRAPGGFPHLLRMWRRQARAGAALPFAVTYERRLVGQLTVSNVVHGPLNSAYVGYWLDQRVAGRGVLPTALALVVDHCFTGVGLHRIEANIRPENVRSRRVVEKLGFRQEGMHRRYLFIEGDYRDHICYAVLAEDVPEGMVQRWHAVRAAPP